MARAFAMALSMPLIERRMRWEAMMTKLRAGTIQQWFADFVAALQRADVHSVTDPVPDTPATPWPLRSVNSSVRYH